MKKLITALLVFTLLLAVGATALAKTYYIKTQSGNYVYVRSGRGTDYERIGKLVYGDHIDVVDIKDGWGKFNFGAYGYGYVYANFLSKTKPEAIDNSKSNTKSNTSSNSKNESSTSSSSGTFDLVKVYEKFTNVSYTAVVQPSTSSNNINMRWAPSTNAPIMGLRRAGCELRVIAENGTWCQVVDEATGECGFMMKQFLLEATNVDGQEG